MRSSSGLPGDGRNTRRLGGCLLFLLLAALASCAGSGRRPNVLLISIDALRADHLGCYGYARPTSPFIDRLARSGTRFQNAFTHTHSTLQSHLSMLSSALQETHRVMYDGMDSQVPESVRMVQETLAAHGYITVGVTGGGYVGRQYGFGRGFEQFDDTAGEVDVEEGVRRLGQMVATSLEFRRRPVFAFFHTYQVHAPYAPAARYRGMFGAFPSSFEPSAGELVRHSRSAGQLKPDDIRHIESLYDGDIRQTDDALRRLFNDLRTLGFLDDCLVILTADHGEEFGEHGGLSHGPTLYEELVRVPLILAGAPVPGGHVDDRLASTLDIVPTILGYLGISPEGRLMGHSLLAPPAEPPGEQAVFLQLGDRKRALRTRTWKLIESVEPPFTELYQVVDDPAEKSNVAGRFPDVVDRLRRGMGQLVARAPRIPAREVRPALGAKQLERLRTLGYLGGHSREETPNLSLELLGSIDPPSVPPEVKRGQAVRLTGWAHTVSGEPVKKVLLRVNGIPIGETDAFFHREDVVAAYGRPDFLNSGWTIDAPLGDLEPGSYSLEAIAVASGGQAGALPSLPVKVLP